MELYWRKQIKLKSPLGAPRITEQPRRHGSSARYIRDPMAQGYRPGGLVDHLARYQGNRLGAQDRPSLFLTILFGRTVITLSNTSRDPWPPGQLGAGRLHYRRVCICVAHGKRCRLLSATS